MSRKHASEYGLGAVVGVVYESIQSSRLAVQS